MHLVCKKYPDDVDLILKFSNILTNGVLISQLSLDIRNPYQQAGHAIIAQLVSFFHGLL